MYDIITLGSSTLDVFIEADQEDRNHKVKGHEHKDICYHLGEKILIRNLSFSAGGGGLNAGVAFSRLGLKTGYIGCIGNDINGKMILETIKKERIQFLGKIKKGNSGYSVIFLDKEDRTILSYKGVNNSLSSSDISNFQTNWLYLGTMLSKSFETLLLLAEKAKSQGTKIAANISSYEASLGIKKLSPFLKMLDILILNNEESFLLTRKKDIKNALKVLADHVKGIIVITSGSSPAYAFFNNSIYKKEIKKIKPLDLTGAGDAFASGFVYGIMKNKGIEKSLEYGCKESSAVIKAIGAQINLLRRL